MAKASIIRCGFAVCCCERKRRLMLYQLQRPARFAQLSHKEAVAKLRHACAKKSLKNVEHVTRKCSGVFRNRASFYPAARRNDADGFAEQLVLGDWAESPRICTVIAVVTEHEEMPI
jgi:hypothetical protein